MKRASRLPGPVLSLILIALLATGSAHGAVETLRVSGGSERVVVPGAGALNPTAGITIEAWVRPDSNALCQTILGKNYLTGYWLGLCSGRIRYYHSAGAGFHDGNAIVPTGQWTHIAVTYDRAFKHYYVNGVLDLSVAADDPFPVNLDDIGIGGEATPTCPPLNTCPFVGYLSEVRLWSVARTRTRIREDIALQIENPRPGLVAVWHLEGDAEDAFGVHDGVLDGGFFSGLNAPPVGEDPLRIPRITGTILDGICDGQNGALRIPVWDDGPIPNVEWLTIAANFSTLTVCLENMPRVGGFAGVYVDPANDGGLFANPDDFRLRLPESGALVVESGTGGGGFAGPGPAGPTAAQNLGNEFTWSAEFRVPRNLIEQGPGDTFRLQVIDDQDGGNSRFGDWGWPVGYFWDVPNRYETAIIDDSTVPPPDGTNPLVDVWYAPSGEPAAGPVELNARSRDSGGTETMTVYLDSSPVETCSFATPVVNRFCPKTVNLSPGRYYLYAEATDFAGRTARSTVQTIVVAADGDDPEIRVMLNPFMPGANTLTTMTVTATDPSGIEFIDIDSHRCPFSGTNTEESCVLDLLPTPGRRVREVIVRAIDTVGRDTVQVRRVLFGNDGPDGDGDGLSDEIEASLCTSPLRPDTDGDTYSDRWEVVGLYFPGSGDIVDLPGLGANPCHKDAFLQYDYEVGARVEPGVIDNIVQAYARNGVALHVEENERPRPTGSPSSPFGGVEGGIRIDENGDYYFPPKYNWTHVYAYGRHNRNGSGHYEGFFNNDIYVGGSGASCACPLSGIDPATCGKAGDMTTTCRRNSADGQTRTFMHELGHMLGLGHGGRRNTAAFPTQVGEYLYYDGDRDHDNHKPNYRGLMNYVYNGDLCLVSGSPPSLPGDLVASYNYNADILPELVENNLDERLSSPFAAALRSLPCPSALPGAKPVAFYSCADPDESPAFDLDLNARRSLMITDGTQAQWRFMHGSASGASSWATSGWNPATPDGIDFDCDGVIEASVSGNLNGNQGPSTRPLPSDREICGDGIDNDMNGTADDGCSWNVTGAGNPLRSSQDWNDFPRRNDCIVVYRESLFCYFQPADYRAQIEANDPALDCRPFLFPTDDCPIPPGGRAGNNGLAEEYEIDGEFLPMPANTEVCDGHDNDNDLLIDEGCRDTDADGVADDPDNCPTVVNADQADTDDDGIGDACDSLVLGTVSAEPDGSLVDVSWNAVPGAMGYAVYRATGAGEFVYQGGDVYPSTASPFWQAFPAGAPVNWRFRVYPVDALGTEGEPGEVAYSTDDDSDGIANAVDNCTLVANVNQIDSNGDGFGNACDPDLNNDGIVNPVDLGLLRLVFFTADADADFNGDGIVNPVDLGVMRSLFFQPPGPSGLATP